MASLGGGEQAENRGGVRKGESGKRREGNWVGSVCESGANQRDSLFKVTHEKKTVRKGEERGQRGQMVRCFRKEKERLSGVPVLKTISTQ